MPQTGLLMPPMLNFAEGVTPRDIVYDLLGEDMGGVWMQMATGDNDVQEV